MTTKTTPKAPVLCRCGCGGATFSVYCPGHDARHTSYVGQQILALIEQGSQDPWNELQALASGALRVKARAMVERGQAKQATRAAKSAQPTGGTVKVGRWTYPARKGRDGTVSRNTKRDGSGAFVPAGPAAATFQAA